MKFLLAGIVFMLAAGGSTLPTAAQTTPAAPSEAPTPAAPTKAAPTSPKPGGPKPGGTVIFSRNTDANGQTTSSATPASPGKPTDTPAAEDADRQAVTFTDFDMDVHLRPADHHIAVRALLTIRNDSKSPLAHIPLQISSQLTWDRIRLNRKDITFPVATLNSDTDHTGQLHEASIALAEPLAPGATTQLDVAYSGVLAATAQRLLAIGTPDDVALHSDWDQVDPAFTGLRGFGNVVWYPVSTVPVILGDGARLFDEIGEHKLRLSGAHFRLRLAVEFTHGLVPTIALIDGHPVALTVTDPGAQNQDVTGVATADNSGETLGFEAPSIFLAIRTPHPATNATLWALPDSAPSIPAWTAAATAVTPFLQSWLGQRPRSQLTILDLPDPQDAPYETGSLLATGIRTPAAEPNAASLSPDAATPSSANQAQLQGILAHALTHAWMQSPRAWLSEGVAHFMGTLWIEKTRGRDQALGTLEAARPALALAEPESPGQSLGQPLAEAISPVYYRTKAAYVLWMLRTTVGDPTLSAALRAYAPAADLSLGYGKDTAATSPFQTLLEQAGTRHDLSAFFADWVNADKGLPDLTIDTVFPVKVQSTTTAGASPTAAPDANNWLVTVNISNSGYAAAEVPVTVRSETNTVTQRVQIPARSKASPHMLILGKPTEVQVNDGTVPETQATVHVKKLETIPSTK